MAKETRTLTFRFFRDGGGRLRVTCVEGDFTRPMESQQGKRYRFKKVFRSVSKFLTEADLLLLQTASEGDVIEVELEL